MYGGRTFRFDERWAHHLTFRGRDDLPALLRADGAPDLNAPFTDEVACDSGNIDIAGPITGANVCPPTIQGVAPNYPQQTAVALQPLPGASSLEDPIVHDASHHPGSLSKPARQRHGLQPMVPLDGMPAVPYRWAGSAVSYVSAPLTADTTVVGGGAVYLWVQSSTPDVDLQATISEVRPDGNETFVQNGWIRASERELSTGTNNMFKQASTLLDPIPTFRAADAQPMPAGSFVEVAIPLYYERHVYRAGSRIRVTISAPNGTQPVWSFGQTVPDGTATVSVALSPSMPSSLVPPVVPGVSVTTSLPACPSLRNEPCRQLRADRERSGIAVITTWPAARWHRQAVVLRDQGGARARVPRPAGLPKCVGGGVWEGDLHSYSTGILQFLLRPELWLPAA
jgi:hypothetical protein